MEFPFYNRSIELSQLVKLFRIETLHKKSFAVVITGQKKSGKTELVKQFVSSINSDILLSSQIVGFNPEKRIITFQCNIESQKKPYSSFIFINEQILKNQKIRLILTKIFKIVLAIFSVNDTLTALTDLADTVKDDQGKNLEKEEKKRFNEYIKFLEKLTSKTPLIFYIKDVQYLDVYSLKLIERILYFPNAFSGAIIFEMNENESNTDVAVQGIYNLIKEGKLTRIHLNPMERDFPAKMLAPIFGEDFFSAEENDLLFAVSKGMPGTLVDFMLSYIKSGWIIKKDDEWLKADNFIEIIQPKEQQLIELLITFFTDNNISDAEMKIARRMSRGWGLSEEYIDFCIKMLSSIASLGYRFEKSLPWGLMSEYVFQVITPDDKHRIVEYIPVDNNDLPQRNTKHIKHDNIVEALTIKQCNDSILIEWDYLEGKRMREILFESNNIHLEKCLRMISDIIQGLQELHRHNIIHSYLRPEAIIESDNGSYILSTIDSDIIGYLRKSNRSLYNDSIYYSAPELLSDGNPTIRSDIYSLGILLYKLITNSLPFFDLNPAKAKEQIINGHLNFTELKSYNNYEALLSFFSKCLMKNPFERYSRLEDVVVVLKKIQETPSEKRIGSDTILDEPAENIVPLTVSKQPKIAYKKVAVLFSIILIAVLVFTFYDKIPTSFVTEKPIDKIVVSISINDGSVKIDKPIVKDIIEFLFQEKMLRSSREKILSGEEFRRLENESSEFKLLPKLAVKGSLSKSKIGYEFEMSIEQNGKRVKDTSITFNDPATFLNNELSPLTAMVLNSKKIKILRDVPITDNWDAIENFVMGSKAWGKLDKIIAKKAVEKALALDPKFTLAKLKYLEIVKFEGDIQQSKLLLAEIYKEIGNLNYIDSVRTLALDNSLKGFYRKAISNYKEIKEYLPQNKNSSYDIAETYYEIRSIDDAIKYYHEALEKDSNFTPAINHLAYCYLDKLEIEKAMYYFTKYIELDPSGNAFDSMADGFFAAGMIDSALSYKLAGIQLDPSLDYLHSSVGLFYAIKGDYKNADSAFSIYADLVNDNPELSTGASFYKAFNEYFAGNLGPAEEIIDASISKINKDSLLGSQQNYWLKGLILFDKGNYDELKNIISIFEKNIKKFRISKEDYHPIYKFYVHLSILKAISEKNKDKIKEFMEILNSDIKFKIKDNGSVFDHAFLSYNLYKVFSEKKFKNPLAATVAKNNAIKANPFYNSIIRY